MQEVLPVDTSWHISADENTVLFTPSHPGAVSSLHRHL